MEVYLQVRRAHFDEGRSKRSIARDFGLARGTVDKMCAFPVPPGYRREQDVRRPKLDGFTVYIDAWLLKDLEVPKKQRHTAKRIYDRLCEEKGFTGGYTTVKDYVRGHRQKAREMFIPLAHPPGHGQADFGEAVVVLGGVQQKVHFFAFDLPQSDACYNIGRLIWNRQSFVKDPQTGRRVSRPNPEASWIIQEVPELRIVPQDLWDAVKSRQEKNRKLVTKDKREGVRSERARRPVYLLSRLLRCGVCGGSYTIISTTRYGCTNAKTRGTCTNRLTIRRDHLEQTVLTGLKSQLLEPDLFKEFIAEYHRQLNAGQAAHEAQWQSKEKELARIKQEIGELIKAIKAGIHSPTLQTEFDELEARKAAVENELASDPPPPVRLHPNLSEVYRAKVEDLREALNDDKARPEAAEILRSLIDEIRLVPGDGSLQIQLIGHLAEMIALAAKEKPEALEPELQVTLVAGARNHLNLLLVAVGIPRVI